VTGTTGVEETSDVEGSDKEEDGSVSSSSLMDEVPIKNTDQDGASMSPKVSNVRRRSGGNSTDYSSNTHGSGNRKWWWWWWWEVEYL